MRGAWRSSVTHQLRPEGPTSVSAHAHVEVLYNDGLLIILRHAPQSLVELRSAAWAGVTLETRPIADTVTSFADRLTIRVRGIGCQTTPYLDSFFPRIRT